MKIKVTLAQEKDVPEICHFFRLEYALCKNWPDKVLSPWITWYCQSGFCSIGREVVLGQGIEIAGHIKSLLLGRPVEDYYRAKEETFYQERDGNCFFVDTILTKHLCTVRLMTDLLIASVGTKEYIAFTRDHGKMEKLKVYNLEKFLRYYAPLPKL